MVGFSIAVLFLSPNWILPGNSSVKAVVYWQDCSVKHKDRQQGCLNFNDTAKNFFFYYCTVSTNFKKKKKHIPGQCFKVVLFLS